MDAMRSVTMVGLTDGVDAAAGLCSALLLQAVVASEDSQPETKVAAQGRWRSRRGSCGASQNVRRPASWCMHSSKKQRRQDQPRLRPQASCQCLCPGGRQERRGRGGGGVGGGGGGGGGFWGGRHLLVAACSHRPVLPPRRVRSGPRASSHLLPRQGASLYRSMRAAPPPLTMIVSSFR